MTTVAYNSYRTCLTNRIESISHYITSLVINSLRGRHTHRCPHRNNFKKPGARWPMAKKDGKTWLQASTKQCTSVTFSQNKYTVTWVYSYSKHVMNFKALYQTIVSMDIFSLNVISVNFICAHSHCVLFITWQ